MWARLDTGQKISAVGHFGLLSVAIFGGTFQADPLPMQVTEVTAISSEDYAALFDADPSPDAVANVDTPNPPDAGQAPELSATVDEEITQSTPEPSETSETDETPEIVEAAPPEADVSDEAPVLQPPSDEVAVLVPEIAEESRPEAAPRVAPETIAQPEPDVRIEDVDQQATAEDENAEQVEESQEETAREAASERIVTEADDAAPARSLRPQARPTNRPRPSDAQTAEPAQSDNDAVEDAIAAALGGTDETGQSAPSGPPLTSGEKDALRVAVQECWNVGSLSTDALNTTVIVAVSMSEDGRPNSGSIRMLSASGGSGAAASQAFEAARRAIIRCGANGFPLPVEKYDQWRDIEITFNPENMRIR
ncbi:MAG: energy transducer TonB [Pseudomonadota bacterium]